eukprot:1925589-Prymnesium_polylepis.3
MPRASTLVSACRSTRRRECGGSHSPANSDALGCVRHEPGDVRSSSVICAISESASEESVRASSRARGRLGDSERLLVHSASHGGHPRVSHQLGSEDGQSGSPPIWEII